MEQGPWCGEWQGLLEEKPRASEGSSLEARLLPDVVVSLPEFSASHLPKVANHSRATLLPQLELLPAMPAASHIHAVSTPCRDKAFTTIMSESARPGS